MKPIKVIVLDADNCIFLNEETREGSEEIKDLAWFSVFPEYEHDELGQIVEQVKQEIAGGRGDRNDIARRVLEHFEGPANVKRDAIVDRCARFDSIVQQGISSIAISSATQVELRRLAEQYSLYINTATPRESIVTTLETLGLNFFKDIYGRPGTKVSNLKDIIHAEGVSADEVLFVGDMQSDHAAACEVGCHFFGMRTKRNAAWGSSQPFPILNSLSELEMKMYVFLS